MGKKLKKIKQMFTRKGFRTPKVGSKEHEALRIEQEARENAQNFLKEYRVLVDKYGMDFRAKLELEPVPKEPEIKPWSESLQENLDVRTACKHEDSEGNGVCTKCRLGNTIWGEDGTGATEEYVKAQYGRIEKEKVREANCKDGKHRISANKDAGKGALAFCTYCRKVEKEMTEEEVTNLLTEDTDTGK